jgi:hypothetical protein
MFENMNARPSLSAPGTVTEDNFETRSGPADLVIVCPHLGVGGVQRVVSTLANTWDEHGWKIYVLTLYKAERVYALADGVTYIPVYELNKMSPSWILEMILLASSR